MNPAPGLTHIKCVTIPVVNFVHARSLVYWALCNFKGLRCHSVGFFCDFAGLRFLLFVFLSLSGVYVLVECCNVCVFVGVSGVCFGRVTRVSVYAYTWLYVWSGVCLCLAWFGGCLKGVFGKVKYCLIYSHPAGPFRVKSD